MSLLNNIVNFAIRKITASEMKQYRSYPKGKTAIILIDTQSGLLIHERELINNFKKLIDFSRAKGFTVIHSHFDAQAKPAFENQAHISIKQAIREKDGHEPPITIAPKSNDIILAPRSTLSAMFGIELTAMLQTKGIEHIVLAGPLSLTTLDSTMRDAVQQDFHVTIIDSLVSGRGETAVENQLKYTMSRYAHEITNLDSFIKYANQSNK